VLIIYEQDCQQHVDVIRQLTQLLQTHCHCQVLSEMTRQEEIRQSRVDFVLDSFKQADVVLVVVSTKLRDAWLAQLSSPDERHLPSVAELLLQRLRDEVVLRPRRIKLVAARFDYTPEMTDTDTDVALVRDVYELMRDIHRLLFRIRGANTSSRLLALDLACCLPLAPQHTVPDLSKLTQSVVVARQHYQQQQVLDDGHASSSFIEDSDMRITTGPCVADNVVDNLPSNVTSGYVSAQTEDLQLTTGRGVVVPRHQSVQASDMRRNSTVQDVVVDVTADSSDINSPRRRASLESLCIDQCISQINADYDNEPTAQHHSLLHCITATDSYTGL